MPFFIFAGEPVEGGGSATGEEEEEADEEADKEEEEEAETETDDEDKKDEDVDVDVEVAILRILLSRATGSFVEVEVSAGFHCAWMVLPRMSIFSASMKA